MTDPHAITTLTQLRSLYATPSERALRKQIDHLDRHCRQFIGLSPFVLLASGNGEAGFDASPRGGAPGFVQVLDAHTLLIPDAPGNNRLDSLDNIVATGRVGLLFLIPGIDETLRVNGRAWLSTAPDWIARCSTERRAPRLVIAVQAEAAYLHCAKALLRAKLWDPAAQVAGDALPTAGEMITEQTGLYQAPETRAQTACRYAPDL